MTEPARLNSLAGEGQPVSLDKLCQAREVRGHLRQHLFSPRWAAIIVGTLNVPGPVKSNPLYCAFFQWAMQQLQLFLQQQGMRATVLFERYPVTGPELYLGATWSAVETKLACIAFEEAAPWGRLLDLDVDGEGGMTVSRESLGFARRRCLLCAEPAVDCGRSGRHELAELLSLIHARMRAALSADKNGDGGTGQPFAGR